MGRVEQALSPVNEVSTPVDNSMDRMVRVKLLETYVDHQGRPKPIKLDWHAGKGHQMTRRWLEPGKEAIMSLGKAEAYFGPFSLIERIERETNSERREKLVERYNKLRDRVVNLEWGGIPQTPRSALDGDGELGPNRFPDVVVSIIETDGTEGAPIHLREEYSLGDYFNVEDQVNRKRRSVNAPQPVIAVPDAQVAATIAQLAAQVKELQDAATAPSAKPERQKVPA